MDLIIVLVYLLFGFLWARLDVNSKKELCWDDAGVHIIIMTFLWPFMLMILSVHIAIGIFKVKK